MNSYWLIGIYLLIIASIFGIARCFKTYKIDAKPLTQQTLFWLAIVIPIVSFIYFGLFAWWGKTPVFSAHGFERFIKISTLPLGLLSLAIPFTAVINNIHRTVQTNEQIKQAESKNKSDFYFSHRKNTIDIFSSLIKEKINFKFHNIDATHITTKLTQSNDSILFENNTLKKKINHIEIDLSIQNTARLYYKFYRKTNHYNYDYDGDFLNEITKILLRIDLLLKKTEYKTKSNFIYISDDNDLIHYAEDIISLESELDLLFSQLTLPPINKNYYISIPFEVRINNANISDYDILSLSGNEKISQVLDDNGKLVKLELRSHLIHDKYLKELIKQCYQLTLDILSLIDNSWKIDTPYPHIEKLINNNQSKYFIPIYAHSSVAIYCDERTQVEAMICKQRGRF